MSERIVSPVSIGALELANRIFMPAMHLNMCHDNMVTPQLIEFYRRRAEGGVGLISVGYATVDDLSGSPGNIGAHDDVFLPGLSSLADAMHEGGAKCGVQLNHAGRYNMSFFLGGKQPIAPSPIPSRMTRETPREMDRGDIERVIGRFADAAERVQKSGFDMVEILAGTGYLISEFLSPITNQRQDEYGGSLENRMRFGLEVVRGVRQRLGDDFPLLVRMNGNDFMDGGNGREELQEFARQLVDAGSDALCINVGWHEAQVPQIVTKVPRGIFAYMARDIKAQVSVPVIASHRINDPEIAERLLRGGYCDMVAMGRSLIADPDLPNKIKEGQPEKILHCVACGQGCFDNLFKMKPVECLCNPQAGHELDTELVPVADPKKVMVVGGGVAGMNAALAAAARGHEVTLYEQSMRLGGQLHLAGAPPGREEFRLLAGDLSQKVADAGITVVLNREVDGPLLQAEKPDQLIIATGGLPLTPPITGVDQDHVVQAWDILSGKKKAGQKVVVIGGGSVGVETALLLAEQSTLSGEELKFLLVNQAESVETLYQLATRGSRQVTLVEMVDKLGANFGKSTRWSMLQDVQRFGVETRMNAKVLEITPDGVQLHGGGQIENLAADTVVLAVGTGSHAPLRAVAAELAISCQVVGDAQSPATVLEATHQGFAAGRGI